MSWPNSIGYWLCLSLLTWWLMVVATWMLDKALRPWGPPPAVVWLLGGVVGSLFARPWIYDISELYRPLMTTPVLRPMRTVDLSADFAVYYAMNWGVVIAIWVLSCSLWHYARRGDVLSVADTLGQSAAQGAPAPVGMPRLLSRLPAHQVHDIVALEAEDHYVRVHGSKGSTLILISLADAIRELEANGVAGRRAHRSWWVATDAVRMQVQRGRTLHLVLTNEIEVPVSTSYRQIFRSPGGLNATAH